MTDSITNFNLAINRLSYLGRKPALSVAHFEIDDEDILAFKKASLEENGIDATSDSYTPITSGMILSICSRRMNLTSNAPPTSYGKATRCI